MKNKKIEQLYFREIYANPNLKVKRYTKDTAHYKGAIIEQLVLNICESFGFNIAPPATRSSDLIINKQHCEIKSSYKPQRIVNNSYYSFSLPEKEKKTATYVIFYLVPEKEFYVIPINEIKAGVHLNADIYYREKSKFYKYKNNWRLLIKDYKA